MTAPYNLPSHPTCIHHGTDNVHSHTPHARGSYWGTRSQSNLNQRSQSCTRSGQQCRSHCRCNRWGRSDRSSHSSSTLESTRICRGCNHHSQSNHWDTASQSNPQLCIPWGNGICLPYTHQVPSSCWGIPARRKPHRGSLDHKCTWHPDGRLHGLSNPWGMS